MKIRYAYEELWVPTKIASAAECCVHEFDCESEIVRQYEAAYFHWQEALRRLLEHET